MTVTSMQHPTMYATSGAAEQGLSPPPVTWPTVQSGCRPVASNSLTEVCRVCQKVTGSKATVEIDGEHPIVIYTSAVCQRGSSSQHKDCPNLAELPAGLR